MSEGLPDSHEQTVLPDAEGGANPQQVRYLTVEECRATLPIKISRREVVRYIRAAGPDFYQEHRRQMFLSPEQWAAVVTTIHPPGAFTRRSWKSPSEKVFDKAQALLQERVSKSPVQSAASAFEKALALTASDMPKPRAVRYRVPR